ncbi:MAG: phosphoglucomutase/phosphomannomutase family protein [Chloroflexota bacterium]
MAKTEIRFGTDGWRAVIAEDYTFDNVRACAQGYAEELKASGSPDQGVVIGWDTRFGSDRFAAAVAEVLAANGIPCLLSDRAVPTPGASYSVMARKAAGGIVITASHNPGDYNGFKVKSAAGGSASPEAVTEIEGRIEGVLAGKSDVKRIPLQKAESDGLVERFDPIGPYLEQLRGFVDVERIRSFGMNIAVDSMYGAGGGLFSRLLEGGNASITEINGEPNPAFPGIGQPEPVEANLERLSKLVSESHADVGLAFDGDADRLGLIDENGVYISTLKGFSSIAHHMLERRGERGAIVSTITMSSMVDRLGEHYGVETPRTAVGFKFVGPKMSEVNALIGGEESGGYAFRGHVPERDGLLSGLLFLEAMVVSGKRPSELLTELEEITGPHEFNRLDLHFDEARRDEIKNVMATAEPGELGGLPTHSTDRQDGVKFFLGKDGAEAWGIVRLSGTEPLVRIYSEAPDDGRVDAVISDLRGMLGI